MSKSLLCSVALVLMLLPSPVRAASIVLDGSGELTGATGVLVGASLYDVSFVDGTCAALFSGRAVPEPTSLFLLGSGLSAAGFFRRRKAQK